jgi:hypothetical protein
MPVTKRCDAFYESAPHLVGGDIPLAIARGLNVLPSALSAEVIEQHRFEGVECIYNECLITVRVAAQFAKRLDNIAERGEVVDSVYRDATR